MTPAERLEKIRSMSPEEMDAIEEKLLRDMAERYGRVIDAEKKRRKESIRASYRRAVSYTLERSRGA